MKSKKQRRPRRGFTDEFRADVVRLCQAGGESIAEVEAHPERDIPLAGGKRQSETAEAVQGQAPVHP